MEFKEILLDGKKMQIISSLSEEEFDDSLLSEEDEDKTAELTDVLNHLQEMEDINNE